MFTNDRLWFYRKISRVKLKTSVHFRTPLLLNVISFIPSTGTTTNGESLSEQWNFTNTLRRICITVCIFVVHRIFIYLRTAKYLTRGNPIIHSPVRIRPPPNPPPNPRRALSRMRVRRRWRRRRTRQGIQSDQSSLKRDVYAEMAQSERETSVSLKIQNINSDIRV